MVLRVQDPRAYPRADPVLGPTQTVITAMLLRNSDSSRPKRSGRRSRPGTFDERGHPPSRRGLSGQRSFRLALRGGPNSSHRCHRMIRMKATRPSAGPGSRPKAASPAFGADSRTGYTPGPGTASGQACC